MKVLLYQILLCCNYVIAPFVLDKETSFQIDSQIQQSICGVDKHKFSRYYWYNFTSTRDGFLIDTTKVRFALVEEEKNKIYNVGQLPSHYENSDKLKSLGIYDIGLKKLQKTVCF